MLVWGRLADRVGHRRIFRAGLVVVAAASFVTAIAPTVGFFIAGRMGQAFGGAMIVPASLALVLPSNDTPWSSASGSLGAAAAPSLSAVVLDLLSWRWVYLLSAPIAVAALVGGWNVLREAAPDDGRNRLDLEGVVIGTTSIALFTLAIVQGSSWGWTIASTIGVLAASAALLPMFIIRSLCHPAPLLDLRVFSARTVWVANVTNGFLSMAGMSIWLTWPLFLQDVWGYSALGSALAITPGPIVAGSPAIHAGRIADRHGHRGVVSVGSVLPAIAVAFFVVRLGAEPDYVRDFLPGHVLFGMGFGFTFAPLNAAALHGVKDEALAQVNASFNTIRNVGAAIGIAVVIAIVGERGRPDVLAAFDRAFIALAILALLAAITFRVAYPSATEEKSVVEQA